MAITLNTLIGTEVFHESHDGAVAAVSDAGLDVDARCLTCVYLTDQEGRGSSFGLVPTTDLVWRDGKLFVDMSQDGLDARKMRVEAQAAKGPVDPAAAPSVLTGPFGYTIAPTLAGALINDMFTNASDRPPLSHLSPSLHWTM